MNVIEFDPARLRCRDVELLSRPGPGGTRSVRLRRDMRTGEHAIVEVAGGAPPPDRCRSADEAGEAGGEELFRHRELEAVMEWARERLGVRLVIAAGR